jgi:hypothetical protein
MASGSPKIGAAYNVFDGVELLEASIRSVRPVVSFVVAVYQTKSNFGATMPAPDLEALRRLAAAGLIDELVHFAPQEFSSKEKTHLVAPDATPFDMGGASAEAIADVFFNELCKREVGRLRCLAHGCDLFMSMDTDEFYAKGQLALATAAMWERGDDVLLCKMRTYMASPCWELLPREEQGRVSALMRCCADMPFRLCVPMSQRVDPTRRIARASRLWDDAELEMHHMSFVRKDLRSKFHSVSNRGNYAASVSTTC